MTLGPFVPEGLDTPAIVVDLDVVDANNRRLIDHLTAKRHAASSTEDRTTG